MIDALLDTTIIVDLARNQPDAVGWMQGQTQIRFGLPVLVAMEMVQGTQNTSDLRHAQRILAQYTIIHLTDADSTWAQTQHAKYWLSHSVGMIDALIAAPAARLSLPLYTLNLKHFQPLPGVKAIRPY